MKAIDIATKNHITMKDLLEVCKDLGITCDSESSELNDQELFLIEKKIEVIKTKKIKEVEKIRKGKKIKLKRKVHVSKELKEKKIGTSERDGKSAKTKKEDPKDKKQKENADKKRIEAEKKETASDTGKRRSVTESRETPSLKKDEKKEDKKAAVIGVEKAAEGASKPDFSKKRKKGKEKEKDAKKKYTKEKWSEKSFSYRKKQQENIKREVVTPDVITITEGISVGDLAKKLNVKAGDVIAKLMKLGELVTINQALDLDTTVILAAEYNTEVKVVSLYDETVIKQEEEDRGEDNVPVPPVVTVMGHVDHGKTRLLDTIRKTNIIDQEFGGITQHIGAYMVNVGGKKITFLDTPGHAAFTKMRARGASVTDIVVLIVAANDGVMPQTIEAINHAKDADVPIIVAINKIDLEDANPQRVKQALAQYDLVPEEWGGTTLFCEISAKKNININELLELILIQTEMLELKANPKLRARGTVLEAKLDVGRGPVTTILIQNGTLRVGDPFVVGVFSGKVRAMFNDKGEQIEEAGPSMPVEVLGISGVPESGDPFEGVESEKFAKQISNKRLEYKRIESAKKVRKVTLESLTDMIKEGELQELRIIVKADVDGSARALSESLEELSNDEVRVKVIHIGTGGINESDVMLASASNAIIIGYHVRPTGRVSDIADKENVSIQFYNIIFEATDSVKAAIRGMAKPEIREEIIGSGEVKQIFKVSKVGTVAGSVLNSGRAVKNAKIRLIRDGVVIFSGDIKSLKRYKDDVNEVLAGQEFGFVMDGYNDVKEGDFFEFYIMKEVQVDPVD